MTTRREFLWPVGGEGETDGTVAGHRDEGLSQLPSNTLRLSTEAMAADFEVIWNPGPTAAVAVASAALTLVGQLEDQLSVYRPHSELSRINRQLGTGRVTVEPRLFALLVAALELARDTDGAFDPTAGALVGLWRQCRRERRLPTPAELQSARHHTGWAALHWDPATCELWSDRAGVELNLNAMGKGYALDRMAEILDRDWPRPTDFLPPAVNGGDASAASGPCRIGSPPAEQACEGGPAARIPEDPGERPGTESSGSWLIHGGYSSLLARGSVAGGDGWPIGVPHPQFPRRSLGTLWLKDRGLSTSGSGVQFFRVEGRRLGHLVDPRSGWPAEELLQVTVLAPTAAEAEALSTAFFVLGVEKGVTYCHNHPEVAALMWPTPRAGRWAEPVLCNLGESDWMPNQVPPESR